MAKISINPVQAGNGLETAINLRLQQIEDTFNDKVLWRSGVVPGEPNSMAHDLDMAENDILNLLELNLGGVSVKADILQNQSDISELKNAVNALWPKGWGYVPFPGATWKWGSISGALSDQTDLWIYLQKVLANETNIATNTADIAAETAARSAADSALQSNIDTEEAARIAEDATFLKLDGTRTMSGPVKTSDGGFESTVTPSSTVAPFDFTFNTAGYGSTNKYLEVLGSDSKGFVIKDAVGLFTGKVLEINAVGYNTGVFDSLKFKGGGALGVIQFTNEAESRTMGFNVGSNGITTSDATEIYLQINNGGTAVLKAATTEVIGAQSLVTNLGSSSSLWNTFYYGGTQISGVTPSGTGTAHKLGTLQSWVTAGGKLLGVYNQTVEKFYVDKDGQAATVATAPTAAAHLTRKDYVDTADALKVSKSGDTMTGALNGVTPTAAAHLTRKDYVDTAIAAIPGGVNPTAIINGNFDIWQRGTTASQTASDQAIRSADRFGYYGLGVARVDLKQSTDVPTYAQSGLKSNYSLHVDVTTADATQTGDEGDLFYAVEGYDYAQLAGGNATLTFWVKSSVTGTYSLAVRNSGKDRSYVTEYSVSAADTWEKKTVTIPLTETGGTWDYTNGTGLLINWGLYGDVASTSTLDTWQSANKVLSTNQVNLMSSATNNFRIAQVKLETGSTSTAFEVRSIGKEYELCSRYYQKSYELGTAPGTIVSTGAITYRATNAGGHTFDGMWQAFSTVLRAVPTVTWYSSNTGSTGKVYDASAAADVTLSSVSYTSTKRTGNPQGAPASAGNFLLGHWTADAEL